MPAPVLWGSELLINAPDPQDDQMYPISTTLSDGSYVVAWDDSGNKDGSEGSIRAQIFNADGSKKGSEFQVNAVTEGDQQVNSISALSDGRFLITYYDSGTHDGDPFGAIRARIYGADGEAGPDFIVNTRTAGLQREASVIALRDGGFVIAYESDGIDGWGFGIAAQVFDSKFTRVGSEKFLNQGTTGQQTAVKLTALSNGNFVAIYTDTSQSGSSTLKGRVFLANGDPAPGMQEFLVGASNVSTPSEVSVVSLSNGRMPVVWTNADPAGDGSGSSIMAQIFEADGSKFGNQFRINTTTIDQQKQPAIVALKGGGFAVAFASHNQTSDQGDVLLTTFDDHGNRVGDEIRVSGGFSGDSHNPTLTLLADGRLAVSWTEDPIISRHGDNVGVFGQIVDPRFSGVTVEGTASADSHFGSRYDDVLNGAGGLDRLSDSTGNDTLDGGAGADLLDGGEGFDFVSFASSAVGVTASVRSASGDGTGDTWISIEGIIGSSHADTFSGNGAAHFQGGAGNDTYQVRAGDTVAETAGGGRDTVLASSSFVLSAGAEVEALHLWGVSSRASYALTGSDTANEILGHAGTNTLKGQGGHDVLKASLGNDQVYGGTGNDGIYGGEGNDRLYGEAGQDIFVLDTRLNKRTNVDRISDFRTRDDSIYLENQYFTKLGSGTASRPKKFKSDMFVEASRAQDAEDRIIYDRKSGALYYDKDGTGGFAQVKIATISNKTKLYYHDFFVI